MDNRSKSANRFPLNSILKSNLGRRIVLLVGMSMSLILTALIISGFLAVRQSSVLIAHEYQALAQTTARYLDHTLGQNLERLDSVGFASGVDIEDGNLDPEKRALHSTYLGSIFDGGVFITDQQGSIVWIEPFRQSIIGTDISNHQSVRQSLSTGRPSISDVIINEADGEPAILMVTTLRNQEGKIVGLIGGQIDATTNTLQEFIRPSGLGETGHIDIIDSNGVILSSSDPQLILGTNLESADRRPAEISESSVLSLAPWSITVRQSEAEALAPVRTMEQRFIVFGLSSVIVAIFLSLGMAISLLRPINQLTVATGNIASGDLSQPIPQLGTDEIGELGRSFDTMRVALKRSLDEIQQWNRELEAKVEERTRQLEDSYLEIEGKEAVLEEILQKILTTQEEERKRIARQLHDETTQSILGLIMRLEATIAAGNDDEGKTRRMLTNVRDLAVETIDNIHNIIFDLRPSVLDDLGLISALRWYTENRLETLNIKVRVEITGEEIQLPPQIEIALFRVVQEAITNIARHASANNVILSVDYQESAISIEVEDDGQGFDTEAISFKAGQVEGLGLLGMNERITLLGGKLGIESQPNSGTRLIIEVPLPGKDQQRVSN